MIFFCFPPLSIPKAKEWKLIQLSSTNMTMAVVCFPNVSVVSFLVPILSCSLSFGLAAGIREDSKALVRGFQPGQQFLMVERQISESMVKLSVLRFSMPAAAHTSQREVNSCYEHRHFCNCCQLASNENITIYNTNFMTAKVSWVLLFLGRQFDSYPLHLSFHLASNEFNWPIRNKKKR